MRRILPILFGITMLTGCGSQGNVSKRAYLRAAAADGNRITFSFYSAEEGVMSITADNLMNAKSAAELALGKEIFTGHTELVILNGCDNLEILDYMLSEWKVSPSCRAVEAEVSGDELLNQRSAEELVGVIDTAQEKKLIPRCDIVTVLGELLNHDKAAIPKLTAKGMITDN